MSEFICEHRTFSGTVWTDGRPSTLHCMDCGHPMELAEAAAPAALDVERLARALTLWEETSDPDSEKPVNAHLGVGIYENGADDVARMVAAEYERLGREP